MKQGFEAGQGGKDKGHRGLADLAHIRIISHTAGTECGLQISPIHRKSGRKNMNRQTYWTLPTS
jgi:hypothetical protein